ncbi:SPASM domain-containing protein [Halobacteriovorax sp. JY17]|uniref:radical SAM/SPASM domain-containing protein n=1 Tax=Halobacteriovorax sp. JY17 TaxID=2014617 RepID=UPI0025BAC078|nr:SPASM domain-containing protein [Halobacteriovorax sp. JY17]
MKKKHEQCPIAISQLYLHSSGKVYPCGFIQGRESIGNIKESSMKEIWNGELATSFRQSHQAGTNSTCSEMQGKYNCHLLHNHINTEREDTKIKRLDIMIDSFCNLVCIMCTNRSEENQGFTNEAFWKELEESILPDIEEIELVGGEPFVVKDTYRLIDLVMKVKPSIRWCFVTNGHFDFDRLLAKRLQHLNIYSAAVSIDSFIPERFKEIRVNGDLDKALDTLRKIRKERDLKKFYLTCNFLIQRDNYDEVRAAINFCKEEEVAFYPMLLRDPSDFSILNFPNSKLASIVKDFLCIYRETKNLKIYNIALKIIKSKDKDFLLEVAEDLPELERVEHD